MNKMFRPHETDIVHAQDIVTAGQQDWDGRVKRAIASETAWKRVMFVCLAGMIGFAGDDVRRAADVRPPEVVHIVHDSLGGVIAVTASTNGPSTPDQIQIKAAVEQWIVNSRSVFVDINALRHALIGSACLIAKSSQADAAFAQFYNTPHSDEPFTRAQTETVSLENVTAVPPTEAEIGAHGMQTWAVNWNERVTSRDGSKITIHPWSANVTLFLKQPDSVAEAQCNPNGVHIVSYSWTPR
jgi:type IV secretion system protein VirB5